MRAFCGSDEERVSAHRRGGEGMRVSAPGFPALQHTAQKGRSGLAQVDL